MNIHFLSLHTRDLTVLHDFYAHTLGFPVGRPAVAAPFELDFENGANATPSKEKGQAMNLVRATKIRLVRPSHDLNLLVLCARE